MTNTKKRGNRGQGTGDRKIASCLAMTAEIVAFLAVATYWRVRRGIAGVCGGRNE